MNTPLIIPSYDMHESIVEYFAQYGLSSFIIPSPFLKLPPGLSEREFFSSRDRVRDFFSAEAYKPENNISWQKVIQELGFPSIAYLNHVLLAGSAFIGSSTRFDYDKLWQDVQKLEQWVDENGYNMPMEGDFPAQYDLFFLKTLMKCGYSKAIFSDEFPLDFIEMELQPIIRRMEDEKLFLSEQVKQVLVISSMFSPDLKIAFTIHRESFFTVLAATEDLLTKILEDFPYEGFRPDKEMTHFL